jgi:hypothetical protein
MIGYLATFGIYWTVWTLSLHTITVPALFLWTRHLRLNGAPLKATNLTLELKPYGEHILF